MGSTAGMLTLKAPEGKAGPEDQADMPRPTGTQSPAGSAPLVDVIDCGGVYEAQISVIDAGSANM